MTAYGFDFIGPDGRIQAIEVGEFADAFEAARQARRALHANLTAVAVDIWSGDRCIARLRRARPLRALLALTAGAPKPKPGRRTSGQGR